jgi:phage gp29-like protein
MKGTPKRASKRRPSGAIVRPDPNAFSRSPYGRITPRRIANAICQADEGYPQELQDLLDEVRKKDPVLHAVLLIREAGVLSCPWSITPTGATARAKEVAALCQWVLEGLKGLRGGLAHLLGGKYHGYAVCAVDWGWRENRFVPAEIYGIEPRRFEWQRDPVRLLFTDDGRERHDLEREYPGRFIYHFPRVTGAAIHREGFGRVILYAIGFRLWGIRDWVQYAERFGRPHTTVRYSKATADESDLKVAEEIAEQGGGDVGNVFSDALTVELKRPTTKQSPPSPEIATAMAKDITLAVLGQLESTGDVHTGAGGKRSARDKVRRDLLRADARDLAEALRAGVLEPLVRFHYGPDEQVPGVAFDTRAPKDKAALTAAVKMAVELGAPLAAEWLLGELGWSAARPGQTPLGK